MIDLQKEAKEYADKKYPTNTIGHIHVQNHFIKGAKSDAAKDLWFNSKEFQSEKLKAQIEVLREVVNHYHGFDTIPIMNKGIELQRQLTQLENDGL